MNEVPWCNFDVRKHCLEKALQFAPSGFGVEHSYVDVVEAAKAFEAYLRGGDK